MYKAKHNLNPRVFDNKFTEMHTDIQQGFLEATLNNQK